MKKLLMLLLLLSLSINLVGCNSKEETSDEIITNEEVEIDEEKNLNEVLEELDRSASDVDDIQLVIKYHGSSTELYCGCQHTKYDIEIQTQHNGNFIATTGVFKVCIENDCDSIISVLKADNILNNTIKQAIAEERDIILE